MILVQLGRQPEISLAELRVLYGTEKVTRASSEFAFVDTKNIDISNLGGSLKCARVIKKLPKAKDDSSSLAEISAYINGSFIDQLRGIDGKITLGISIYGLRASARAVQKIGIVLKAKLKKQNISLRLVPNEEVALSSATSHNNKLGLSDKKIELVIIKTFGGDVIIASSLGAQNITSYTKRDRLRPRRDAFVGMLPPKLAQIMLNLAVGGLNIPYEDRKKHLILDPFCGTGTVLQEALIQGYSVVGSDLSEKMVSYTKENLDWLKNNFSVQGDIEQVTVADATTYQWSLKNKNDISAVVCETYLGQPFSAPPSPAKLKEVTGNCNHIITTFLENIHKQLPNGSPLCIAVPAWQAIDSSFTHLPLINNLSKLGYERVITSPLLYHRPGQVVGREILVLKTK